MPNTVLSEIRAKYYEHASKVIHKRRTADGHLADKYKRVVEWYRRQGDLVGGLICGEECIEVGVEVTKE